MWLVFSLCVLIGIAISLALPCNANGIRSDEETETQSSERATSSESPLLIASWGENRYVYEPSFLPVPQQSKIEHAHGIVIDQTDNGAIIITYQDEADQSKCLLRWRNITAPAEVVGPKDASLCKGIPHGLIAAIEDDESSSINVLYHANNEQALHKTNMNGDILWTVDGKLDQKSARNSDHHYSTNDKHDSYSPTWFASQPESPYIYLADGYGSSKIYVLNKINGNYTGYSFGGIGTEHGKFQTSHSVAYDPRFDEMVVCDRENHRLEYFRVDKGDPSVFDYLRTVSFDPLLRRPCNIRVRQDDGYAIVAFLEGSVGILDNENSLVDVINVTASLGDRGFLHPHDAHFVPGTSGDFVVVTWNPGRIGYFRRVAASSESWQ